MRAPSQEARLSGHPDAQALAAPPELCRTHQLNSREPIPHPGLQSPQKTLPPPQLSNPAFKTPQHSVCALPVVTWNLWGSLSYGTVKKVKCYGAVEKVKCYGTVQKVK